MGGWDDGLLLGHVGGLYLLEAGLEQVLREKVPVTEGTVIEGGYNDIAFQYK